MDEKYGYYTITNKERDISVKSLLKIIDSPDSKNEDVLNAVKLLVNMNKQNLNSIRLAIAAGQRRGS